MTGPIISPVMADYKHRSETLHYFFFTSSRGILGLTHRWGWVPIRYYITYTSITIRYVVSYKAEAPTCHAHEVIAKTATYDYFPYLYRMVTYNWLSWYMTQVISLIHRIDLHHTPILQSLWLNYTCTHLCICCMSCNSRRYIVVLCV